MTLLTPLCRPHSVRVGLSQDGLIPDPVDPEEEEFRRICHPHSWHLAELRLGLSNLTTWLVFPSFLPLSNIKFG